MNIKIVNNQYLNSLLVFILFSAILHVIVIFTLAIMYNNLRFLNYFSLLELSYFLPNFFTSFTGDIVSLVVMISIYLFILKNNKIQ